jgi:hypothetical protein
VEGGREHLNKSVRVSVTSVLQTSAGRMIFGRAETVVRKDKEKKKEKESV